MSDIAKYFANQHVFITGGTGFMGKILIEKLLRSCPEIGAIYLLIRPKKGLNPQERINELINNCELFNYLRTNSMDILKNKLICINGDILDTNLNLSNDDEKLLIDNVTIIFHMAANVRFDQSLKIAVNQNLRGTLNVLELSLNFNKLVTFMYVSTSYCHCNETIVEEKLYPAPHDPRKILDLVTWMDNETLELITPKLLNKFPNTYAYTKCLTEHLTNDYLNRLPIVIVRPSIVIASWKEPLRGWVDNLNGPTGLLVGAGKGVIRSMHCNPNLMADIIPVDTSINAILIVAWWMGVSKMDDKKSVYNLTANKDNTITWGETIEIGKQHVYKNPFSVCLWYPGGSIKSNYYLHTLAVFFFHLIPAYTIDFLLMITGNKPFLIRTQKRIQNGLNVLQYYTTRPWYFHNDNLNKLWMEKMNDYDRKIFYTHFEKIDFSQYILNYVLGARKYCVKEEPETLPYARKILKRLYYLDLGKNIILFLLILWVLKIIII